MDDHGLGASVTDDFRDVCEDLPSAIEAGKITDILILGRSEDGKLYTQDNGITCNAAVGLANEFMQQMRRYRVQLDRTPIARCSHRRTV